MTKLPTHLSQTRGFSLVELLIAISLMGVIASAIFIFINPVKKQARSRDAIRKDNIATIAGALQSYYLLTGTYPFETTCDSSLGSINHGCPILTSDPGYGSWKTTSYIYVGLITNQSILKSLPKDPLNNNKYYYKYEPGYYGNGTSSSNCTTIDKKCFYWIGAKLEAPTDPAKPIYRCSNLSSSDYPGSPGTGCRETNTTGGQAGELNGGRH